MGGGRGGYDFNIGIEGGTQFIPKYGGVRNLQRKWLGGVTGQKERGNSHGIVREDGWCVWEMD